MLENDWDLYDLDKEHFFVYDIALIMIDTPFNDNHGGMSVCPICLMPNIMPPLNQDITIVGMGKIKNNNNNKTSIQDFNMLQSKKSLQKNALKSFGVGNPFQKICPPIKNLKAFVSEGEIKS